MSTALASAPAAAQWAVWSTTARVVVTDPGCLPEARRLVEEHLRAVDRACSRFRVGSEVDHVAHAHGRPVMVSALLAAHLRAALDAARHTDGAVDPTVGAALCALGYDRDIAAVRAAEPARLPAAASVRPAAGWRRVRLEPVGERALVTVPAGTLLDLGATAKALAADRGAEIVSTALGCGVLVSLGGDIATAGPAPTDWQVLVQDSPADPVCIVGLPAGHALATSSTVHRSWTRGGRRHHHLVDPATGAPAPVIWRSVSVAARTCLRANTLSTAALVRPSSALEVLARSAEPARLVAADGSVVLAGGWPSGPGDEGDR